MSFNNKLDRRHDINKNERLPERLTRVQDMEIYWDGIERVLNNENDTQLQAQIREAKELERVAMEEKKTSIKAGDVILLMWAGVQVVKVQEVTETGVKVGPHRYGWEIVQKPSSTFLEALKAEVGEVEL